MKQLMLEFKLVFRRRHLYAFAALTMVGVLVGFIGLARLNRSTVAADRAACAHRCGDWAMQIADRPESFAAATQWKKAKDKFLSEFKKLTQPPPTNEHERRIIRLIEESWRGFDVSFNKYVLASAQGKTAVEAHLRNQAKALVGSFEEAAELNASYGAQATYQARIALLVLAVLIALLGLAAIVFILGQANAALNADIRVLAGCSAQSDDELSRQANQLKEEIQRLNGMVNRGNAPDPQIVKKHDPPTMQG